jgi:ubiquinone/menaquinone biosynthesis C-methylase UbiE
MLVEQVEKEKYKFQWEHNYLPSKCALPLVDYVKDTAQAQQTLLDIGCGNGITVAKIRECGYRCDGIDITLAGIQGVFNPPLIEATLWKMPFMENAYDYTFSTDVLEHIPLEMVEDSIKEIIRITKVKTFHCIASFSHKRYDVELHPTLQPIDWWYRIFEKYNTKGLSVKILDRWDFLKLK